jgi:hypothetical protein
MNPPNTSRKGRLDLAILAFGEHLSGRFKDKTGVDIWENGGKELAEEFIRHWGIPQEPINIPMTIARNVGLLPQKSKLRRVG